MNQQTVTVSCPKGCEGDCDNCLKGINDGFELADEEQWEMLNEDKFPTPPKFQHLETLPLKPHYHDLLNDRERKANRLFCMKRHQGRKPRYSDNRRRTRLAPIMARQLEAYWTMCYEERLWMEAEEGINNLTAQAEVIELDFDQACEEQAEFNEEMRLRKLNILYYDEIEDGFNEMFAQHNENRQYLMAMSGR